MLATGGESFDGCRAQGPQFAQNGRHWLSGPLRQDVPALQRPAHLQEKDARQKANAESRIQREFRV